MFDSV